MNYVGMLVEHNAFGQGKIIKQDSRFIEVAFDDGGIKRFVYPDAFNRYLSFVNEEYLPEETAPKRREKYVGQTVRHSIYGLGTITSQEAHFVSVSFGGREKRFVLAKELITGSYYQLTG